MDFEIRKAMLFILVVNGLCWIAADGLSMTKRAVVSLDQYRQDCLKTTNEKRALHGSPAMSLDDSLNKLAQEWAEHLLKENKFEHRDTNYGENIYKAWGSFNPASQAVNNWYNEISNYDFKTHSKIDPKKMVGHFTQLVWKSSVKLGVGMAYDSNSKVMVVVNNYDPSGNMGGAYESNVFPLKDGSKAPTNGGESEQTPTNEGQIVTQEIYEGEEEIIFTFDPSTSESEVEIIYSSMAE